MQGLWTFSQRPWVLEPEWPPGSGPKTPRGASTLGSDPVLPGSAAELDL